MTLSYSTSLQGPNDGDHAIRVEFTVHGQYVPPSRPTMAGGGDLAEYPEVEILGVFLLSRVNPNREREIEWEFDGELDNELLEFCKREL